MKPNVKECWQTRRKENVTKVKEGKNLHQNHFESVSELQTWLTEYDPQKDPKSMGKKTQQSSSSSHNPDKGWDLNAGWNKAREMSYSGWEKGAEDMRKCMEAIEDELPSAGACGIANGFDWEYSDEGDELDIDSYLEGDDRCWANPVFHVDKPIVRCFVNISASAGVSAQCMAARGAVVCAMICKLERLGYGVQVYSGDCGYDHGGNYFVNSVKVKDSDEFLHEGLLAFWLSHPAALRRIGFRMIEAVNTDVCNIPSSYGMPANFASDDFDFVSDGAHLNDAQSEGWHGDSVAAGAAATKMIKEIIEQQNNKV